ncbi:restriction endonuclease subunit S [Nocardia neocaledoniensis]|nr:restriction endonuclease subunit S [Nocardia neocaledoniensis]
MTDTWNPRSHPGSTFDYIDIAAVDHHTKTIVSTSTTATSGAPSRARQLVATGDVLVSTVRPNLNAVASVPPELDGATASTGFCVLRPKAIDNRYLFHWVRSPQFVSAMTRLATGQSYPAVSDKIIKSSLVPTPTLSEQQRIAQALDQVDLLREKRRKSIALLDDLAQSIFLDMFEAPDVVGEPIALGAIAEISSGITKGRKVPPTATTRTVPYLAVVNVQDKQLRLDTLKEIEATEPEIDRYRLAKDDLLLTEGGDPDKLGRGTLWRNELEECIHQNHIFRVRLKDELTFRPIYLNWAISSERGRRYFLRSAKQTTGIASINATQLRNFPVPSAPIATQQLFEDRIEAIARCKRHHETSLSRLDTLFFSIQSRAFRGELWQDDLKDL